MSKIKQLCSSIERGLFRTGSVSPESFFPPLKDAELTKYFDSLGFKPKADLLELYGWRNGQDYTALFSRKTLPFFRRFFFLPLHEAIKRKPVDGELDGWLPSWLPILDDYAGDYMFIDLADKHPMYAIGGYDTTSDDVDRASIVYKSIEDFLLEVDDFWKETH